ncbi:MAG: sigma-70 family RNA polymerase sigma factor [Verrucomicrobia bacterium]|nr:sigma-70 family RNA polymerase sigma factor [Verrucomicrobiota bacterium]
MSLVSQWLSPFDDVTDEQAMWRVQTRDDPTAFAELVRRWEPPVRRLCLRMTGDEHRGEDLAQEAFARVFAHRHAYQHGRKFSTWLWRIALNLCHDEARRVNRRGEFPLDDAEDGPPLRAFEPSPDERLIEQERAELVRQALLTLPDTLRAVVVLREYEGLKLREIGETLDIPEGTVKSRLADALTRLSRRLKPFLNDEPASPPEEVGTVRRKAIP